MLDSILLEQLGTPTAVVITSPFEATARAVAQLRGLSGYSFAVVEHPISSLSLDELAARAAEASDQAERLLWPSLHVPAPTPGEDLVAVVDRLAEGLRHDGANLIVEAQDGHRIQLRVTFGSDTCAECVLPPPQLRDLVQAAIRAALWDDALVDLLDPRAPRDR